MKIRLKTLTPVHIGTGRKLSPLEFFNYHRINFDKLFELLAEEKKREFVDWIDQNPEIKVNDIQRKFNLKTNDIIKKCSLYSLRGSFQNNLNEGLKDSSDKMLIPGSSLKGSLRTALMYKVLSQNISYLNNQLDELLKKPISRANSSQSLIRSADDNLDQEVFICGVEKVSNNGNEITYNDQKYDLLKLVTVSDSTSVETNSYGEVSELQVFALNKSVPHRNFKIFTESISSNVELEFDISIDIEFLKKAQEELKSNNKDFGKKYFIKIEEKLKRLFDIDIINDEEFNEEQIVNTIIKAWIDFGEAVSDLEKKWLDSIKDNPKSNINLLKKLYETKNKIKVGFGAGFSGMTILPLLLGDSSLSNKAEEFYKNVKIGFHRSANKPLNIDEFPFTRKYSNNQNIYGGFGWIQIISNNLSSTAQIPNEKKSEIKPPNTVLAEITDDKSKPPKIKILEGEYINKETTLPKTNLIGLKLKKGSKIYVKLIIDKKNIQKAEYKGRAE